MKARTSQFFVLGGVLLAVTAFAMAEKETDLETVASVDLARYTGQWYEIARFPDRFQEKCTGNVTASYRLLSNGKVEVINKCQKANGEFKVAKGKAKASDKTGAKLRVTFFWPFYGDYWVIGLDPEYRWAIVGEPSRKYLWVLSRTPRMKDSDYDRAVQTIRDRGYDPSHLVATPQT